METPPGRWLDPRPLQPSWPEPVPALRVPRWVRVGGPVLLLALLTTVIAAGGFEGRTDQQQVMAPGAELDCGNLVYTFTSATVRPAESLAGEPVWEVQALGTARNPHDEPLAPIPGDFGSFVVRGAPGPEVAILDAVQIGAEGSARSAVPPGEVALPLQVGFELPGSYVPRDRIQLAALVMEYTDNSVLGTSGGERTWNKADDAWMVYLPLTVLPAAEEF